MASSLNSIGNIFFSQSDYPSALEFYFNSLKIQESIDYKIGMANALSNIGMVYKRQGNVKEALDYSLKSLTIEVELGNQEGIGTSYANIGNLYMANKEYALTYSFFTKALLLYEKNKDKDGIATIYSNYGKLFENEGKIDSSLFYNRKALEAYTQIDKAEGQAIAYLAIANNYFDLNKLNDAIEFGIRGFKLSKELGSLDLMLGAEGLLGELYEKKGEHKNALAHFKNYLVLKDSIFNVEKNNELTRYQLKYEFEKKADADSIKNLQAQNFRDTQIQLQKAQLSQEKTKGYMLYGGLLLLVLFGIYMINRFNASQKQKAIIEHQNELVKKQKELVESKNKEVMDSINYAKRIQQSILPTNKYIDNSLKRLKKKE
jgi:tetratricopeptide (TPR) repeat protein